MRYFGIVPTLLVLAGLAGSARGQNYVFGPNVRVNDNQPPGSAYAFMFSMGQHSIAVRGDTVYIAWSDDRTGSGHIYFSRSKDAGRTFGSNIKVDRATDRAWNASLAVDDVGGVHLCWAQMNAGAGQFIYYARSTDGGRTFQPPIRGCDSVSDDQYGFASIAVSRDGRRIYVVRDDYNYHPLHLSQIFLARSTDGGASFLKPDVRVNTDTTRTLRYPSIALFEDTILLVSYQCDKVWCARSRNAGTSFEPDVVVSETAWGYTKTAVASAGAGRMYFVCEGVLWAVSSDTGRTFSPLRMIPRTGGGVDPSFAVLPDGRMYVGFSYWNGFGGNYDVVRLVYSPDGGDTWYAPVDPSDGPIDSWENRPTLTASQDGRMFMAWSDRRNDIGGGNYDIYLATGALSGIEERSGPAAKTVDFFAGPSPARSRVTIEARELDAGRSRLEVLDATGRLVQTLRRSSPESDRISAIWDCRNGSGDPVPAGIYFIKLKSTRGSVSREVQVLAE